eukprot:COSAG04_NODE_17937_length_455_cov_1.300562_2_plen_28_part_01
MAQGDARARECVREREREEREEREAESS